jgi:hypothetical protein
LCSHGNEQLIRVFRVNRDTGEIPGVFTQRVSNVLNDSVFRSRDQDDEPLYPSDAPIGTEFGLYDGDGQLERGLSPTNRLPWCVRVDEEPRCVEAMQAFLAGETDAVDEECQAAYEAFQTYSVAPNDMPFCPPGLLATATDGTPLHRFPRGEVPGFLPPAVDTSPLAQHEFRKRWVRHGAMNAGLSAYYYLDALSKGLIEPAVPFDECEGP